MLRAMTVDQWRSTLYALLEGVSERLQISRDDIDGTLYPTPGGHTSLVIFDMVPGGAGRAIRIARSFGDVLEAALGRVAGCDCGIRLEWSDPHPAVVTYRFRLCMRPAAAVPCQLQRGNPACQ
jgi:hypothetical protein